MHVHTFFSYYYQDATYQFLASNSHFQILRFSMNLSDLLTVEFPYKLIMAGSLTGVEPTLTKKGRFFTKIANSFPVVRRGSQIAM